MGFRSRAPVPDDAPAVLAVLAARDIADFGEPDYTLEDLRQEWRGSDVDLAADALVVEVEGEIGAYAIVRRPGALAVVSPDHERNGIGAFLLGWVEERERQRGRERHRQWIGARNARAQELLTNVGYVKARSYWRMARRLRHVTETGAPEGVELRALDVDRDADEVYALSTASFSLNPDYEPESFVEFREDHLAAHDLDTGLSRVARRRDRMIGVLLARRWTDEGVGYVDLLGVHPDHQRRGLGSALLQSAFAAFASAGLREAQLGVASDNPKALRLYERVGMSPRFQADTYERPVTRE